jgi:hypothetical protein
MIIARTKRVGVEVVSMEEANLSLQSDQLLPLRCISLAPRARNRERLLTSIIIIIIDGIISIVVVMKIVFMQTNQTTKTDQKPKT